MITVAARKKLHFARLPRWIAARARTIVTDEQISTKVLPAVRLMASGLMYWS